MPKMQPAVKTLEFDMNGVDEQLRFIDIGQCVSIVNRRAYRQGMQWVVGGIRLQTTAAAPNGGVTISKLPETWVVSAAWEKAMSHWMKQQNDALKSTDAKGRFNDFKIYANTAHASLGSSNNLIPIDGASVPFATGEWLYSEVVIPNDGGVAGNTVEYSLKMVGGDDPTVKSIIHGYQEGRPVPQSPDPDFTTSVSNSWLNEMFDDGETNVEVLSNAQYRNDQLPYDQNNYPGGDSNGGTLEIVQREIFSNTTIGRTVNIPGFIAPCGLLQIQTDTPIRIFVYLVPGNYRGYLAAPMQEM